MSKFPPPYPHQVVSDWIATNDVHVLADFVEREPLDITWGNDLSPLDYDVCARRARKMQAETIAAVSRIIGTAISQVVSNIIGSLRDHWRTRRQIEQLSRLSPRLLDDAGIPREIQVRIRTRQTHS